MVSDDSEISVNPDSDGKPKEKEDGLHRKIIDLEQALNYCHKSYLSCSEQRLTTFRYFIIYIAALAYGFYEVHEHEKHLNLYIFLIIFASLIISYAFYKLERRNHEILQITESGCREIENVLAISLKEELLLSSSRESRKNLIPEAKEFIKKFDQNKIKIMTNCAELRKDKSVSYKQSIKIVFAVVFSLHILMLLMILYCNLHFCKENNSWICPKKCEKLEKKEYIYVE